MQRTAVLSGIVGLACLVLGMGCRGPEQDLARGSSHIDAASVSRHLNYLASDALQGRNTPSPGLDSAAAYIAREFARSGVGPVQGRYFQPVRLNIISLGDTNTLRVTASGVAEDFALKDDFTPFDNTGGGEVEGELVFAGYGISAPEYHYDDYAGIDVKGKIVLVLRHEPGEEDSSSVFLGKRSTEYSNVTSKTRQAIGRGAKAVLVMTDPLNHTSLTPRGFPWPSLSKLMPKDALPMTLASEGTEKIPVVHVGEKVMVRLFGSVDSLVRLQASIDRAFMPRSFVMPGVRVRVRTSIAVRDIPTQNVAGVIEGSDSVRAKELVVIGAHYDHVGVKRNTKAGEDSVFNGADDNASGTVALLEVARAFGGMGRAPRRSVLLIAFTGEEKGLFGSEYYVRNPLFPLGATKAMLNMDMVGRGTPDSLQLIGADEGSALLTTTIAENHLSEFILMPTKLTQGDSDHTSFAKRGIPVIFYHTGLHEQYHKVTDHADLIDTKKVARVADLVFRTAWRIADSIEPSSK
jgi:hypothetical protein